MDYVEAFENLKPNEKYGRKTPHKAVLLLTIIEMCESDEIYSLDLVSTKGSNIHSQTFRLPESEMQKAEELEKSIDKLLDGIGNDNVSVCTLLKILNKKLG